MYGLQAYVREALVRGEPTNYNIANSAGFREMGVVKAARRHPGRTTPSAPIYSNYVNIVWFILRHPVRVLPYEDQDLPRAERLVALPRNYPGLAAGARLYHLVHAQPVSSHRRAGRAADDREPEAAVQG